MAGWARFIKNVACKFQRSRGWLAAGMVVGALSAAAAPPAMANPRAQLEQQQAQLFQEMLKNPADLKATLAYAEVSARLGDNEAAVTAFERLLMFNPNLLRVNLELGALYFRMGSFEVSRIYFEKVLAAHPPPAIRVRVEEYLRQIATRLSRTQLTGIVTFGAQYQTDANVAPGSALIDTPIFGPLLLNNQYVKHSDWDIFATESTLYSYDLGTQNNDRFEVGSAGFVNHYMQFPRLDLDLLELTAGPRFNFPMPAASIRAASLKPYFIADEVGLGYHQYFYTLGGGIETTAALPNNFAVKVDFEFRQKNFSNAPDRPFTTGLTGNDKIVSLVVKKLVTSNSDVNFEFDYLDQETRFAHYSNQAYAFTGSYNIHYADPIRILNFPWETAIYLGYLNDDYDAFDPCCNTSSIPGFITLSKRHDVRWQFGVTQTFQVAANVAVLVQFQRDIVGSNLPLYAYTSNSVLIGPEIRF